MEFKTLKEASSAFSELEISSTELLDESAETIKSFEAAETESKQAMADAVDKVETLESKVESLEGENTKLEVSNKELEENKLDVQKEAARIASEAGVELKDLEKPDGDQQDANALSREDFEALSLIGRMAFFKQGGKITV